MNLPKLVVICGIPYSVEYTKDIGRVDTDRRRFLRGQCDPDDCTIRILTHSSQGNEIPIEEIFNTLLHEITHATIKFGPRLVFKDADSEEEFVAVFANIFSDTLIRNGLAGPVSQE